MFVLVLQFDNALVCFQDVAGKELHLGVTSIGLVVFQNGVRINVFSWGKIVKISFKRKQFFIQLRREQVSKFFSFQQVFESMIIIFNTET